MKELIEAIKKIITPKVVKSDTKTKDVCVNCNNSGMTCSVCGTGKVQD